MPDPGERQHDSVDAKRKHRHERSRPQYRPDAGEPALRRKNPFRRLVPLAGGARQKALPHARRCAEIRRAKGKPARAPARPVHQGRDRRAKADSGVVGRSEEVVASDEMICLAETWNDDERGISSFPPQWIDTLCIATQKESLIRL